MITPEKFDALDPVAQAAEVERYNETEREWRVRCPRCGHEMTGKLHALRGASCGVCGLGGNHG